MQEGKTVKIHVEDEDSVFVIMGEIRIHCRKIGFNDLITQKLVTATSELCYNIIKHAGKGHIEVTPIVGETNGIRIRASDKGPGIQDIQLATSDNYSTAGTLGLGLPSIIRMVDDFDIDSKPGSGTIVTIAKWV